MSTPLERASETCKAFLAEHGVTYIGMFGIHDPEVEEYFWYSFADEVLGHARLPEELDVATELRTANLLTLATFTPDLAVRERILGEVDKRMGRA